MRKFYLFVFSLVLFMGMLKAQNSLFRHYPLPSPPHSNGYYAVETPVRTADGGYILLTRRWCYGFESPCGMMDCFAIKTDSNFVPQWRKQYYGACPLPTGGIILFGFGTIEKVTASGAQVWIKSVGPNYVINDAITYGSNLRLAGSVVSVSTAAVFFTDYISDGTTVLMDTSGNYISQQLFYSSSNSTFFTSFRRSCDFSKIERDQQGNFYVYSNAFSNTLGGSEMTIAKFNSSFGFLWVKAWPNNQSAIYLTDIDPLANGRVFAAGYAWGGAFPYYNRPSLFKFDASGNVLQSCFFNNKSFMSSLCKKPNGNYIAATMNKDSIFILETDTAMNIIWHKFRGMAPAASGPVIHGNQFYNSLYWSGHQAVISDDLSGNSCASYTVPYAKSTLTTNLVSFTLVAGSSSLSVVSLTTNNISSQTYMDSCNCPAFAPMLQQNFCVGNSATVNIVGNGNLSWYATASGNTFLHSGPQHIFSSSTPTAFTVYAQDSTCALNPVRTPISTTFYPLPNVGFSPPSPTICAGNQVFLSVGGALTYTWSGNLPNGSVQNLSPSVTTIYTVTGYINPGCFDTKTVSLLVAPVPNITITGPSSLCLGDTAHFYASGASSITWLGGPNIYTGPHYTVLPGQTGMYSYSIAASNGSCNSTTQLYYNVLPTPTVYTYVNPNQSCAGDIAIVTGYGANTYTWSTNATGSIALYSPTSTSVYSVTGKNNYGCIDTAMFTVSVVPLPVINITGNAILCFGNTATLSATGAGSYTWSTGSIGPTLALTPAFTTTYTVIGTGINYCTSSAVKVVTVNTLPTLSINGPRKLCAGNSCTLVAAGTSTGYVWSNLATTSSIIVAPAFSTAYTVTGTGSNGCPATKIISLTVQACLSLSDNVEKNTFRVGPNPFKDYFNIYREDADTEYGTEVYNSIGQLVWKGNLSATEAKVSLQGYASGAYFLFLKSENSSFSFRLLKAE